VCQQPASQPRLHTGHEFALLAGRLKAVLAVRTRIVGDDERADRELINLDVPYVAADLDRATVFAARFSC